MATDMLVFFLKQMGIDPKPKNISKLRRLIAEAQLNERKHCIAYVEHCKERFEKSPHLSANISVAAEIIREGLLTL